MAQSQLSNATLFTIKETPSAGRGVFPTSSLPAGTSLLTTNIIPAYVILREYKKEVCTQCFTYEQGRAIKIRDGRLGLYFCSETCQLGWRASTTDTELAAIETVESFVKNKSKTRKALVYDGVNGGFLPDASSVRPSVEQINYSWNSVSSTADFIRQARAGSQAKPHRRALQAALTVPPNPNVLSFLLSGILTQALRPDGWRSLTQLVSDETPYPSPSDLENNVYAYLQLLALLPTDLLPHVQPNTCRAIVERDSHNSFGIRSLDDDGDEFFGYALWPKASFFNHSCKPNVAKKRTGRSWEFWLLRDVNADQELTISYLGGEENELGFAERRRRLQTTWGFECQCERCDLEDAEKQMSEMYFGSTILEESDRAN
jgi:SET and MYND domain-containing protein